MKVLKLVFSRIWRHGSTQALRGQGWRGTSPAPLGAGEGRQEGAGGGHGGARAPWVGQCHQGRAQRRHQPNQRSVPEVHEKRRTRQ